MFIEQSLWLWHLSHFLNVAAALTRALGSVPARCRNGIPSARSYRSARTNHKASPPVLCAGVSFATSARTPREPSCQSSAPATLHNHANQHADGLPQSACDAATWTPEEESINLGLRFQALARHQPAVRGRGAGLILHTPLAVRIVKKRKHAVERLFWIVDHVGELDSLPILEERVSLSLVLLPFCTSKD